MNCGRGEVSKFRVFQSWGTRELENSGTIRILKLMELPSSLPRIKELIS